MFKGFAKIRVELTIAAFLRRISRELHKMNELAELRLKFENAGLYKAYKSGRTTPKMTEISVPSVADWNANWEKGHPTDPDDEE